MRFSIGQQKEIAPEVAVDLEKVARHNTAATSTTSCTGQVFAHPRGYTFERSEMRGFATTFMQTNPLYLNVELRQGAWAFPSILASPQHGVQRALLARRAEQQRKSDGKPRLLQRALPAPGLRRRHGPGADARLSRSETAAPTSRASCTCMTMGLNQGRPGRRAVRAQDHGQAQSGSQSGWESERAVPAREQATQPAFPWLELPVVDAPLSATPRQRCAHRLATPTSRTFSLATSSCTPMAGRSPTSTFNLDLSRRQHPPAALRRDLQSRPFRQDERRADRLRRSGLLRGSRV
jgi:hypothetical protein